MKVKPLIAVFISLLLAFPRPLFAPDEDAFGDRDETFSSFAPGQSAQVIGSGTGGGFSDRITLELKGVNVLDVLKILAKRSGLNIVAGRNVRGDVTLYMQDVEVRRALDTIVRTLDLAYDEEDGIITVMSQKEFQSLYGVPFRDKRVTETFKLKYAIPSVMNQLVQQMKSPAGRIAVDERTGTIIVHDLVGVVDEMRATIKEFDQPLTTRIFDIQYAVAEDLGEELIDYLTPEVGILKIDKRTNRISVTDRLSTIEHFAKVVEAFDQRPQQVLIDAKIVEVQLYDAFRFGIDWDWVDLKAGSIKNVTFDASQVVTAPGSLLGSGTLSTLTLGSLTSNDSYQIIMSILENVGKTNILSSPRILVLNNEEARLAVATREPIVTQTVQLNTATSSTADQVDYVDVGITMSVVPTISADGNVILKIRPEVSSLDRTITLQSVASGSEQTFTRGQVPVVTTQLFETTVVVKNGATVVIGGLIKDKQVKIRKKIPILGDIPFLGAAFRTEANDLNKTELIVFITPHIVTGNTSTVEYGKYLDHNGDWIEFNKVGGYDFVKAEATTSQGPMRVNDKSYWDSPVKEKPIFLPRKDTALRAWPFRGKLNQYEAEEIEGEVESSSQTSKKTSLLKPVTQSAAAGSSAKPDLAVETLVLSNPHHARRHYRSQVEAAIRQALELRDDLGRYPITVELFLIIERDGKLSLKNLVSNKGLSPKGTAVVMEILDQLAPFPSFPKDMNSSQELIDLRLELA